MFTTQILFNKWSYAGWITAIVAALPNDATVGAVYIVGAVSWSLEVRLPHTPACSAVNQGIVYNLANPGKCTPAPHAYQLLLTRH